jgi:hypothetical protein
MGPVYHDADTLHRRLLEEVLVPGEEGTEPRTVKQIVQYLRDFAVLCDHGPPSSPGSSMAVRRAAQNIEKGLWKPR